MANIFTQEDPNFPNIARAGYGSAFILSPATSVNSIDELIRQNARREAAAAKAKGEKTKASALASKQLFGDLDEIQGKIHPADLPVFQQKITDIMGWAQQQKAIGQDPLDMQSPAYFTLVEKINKIKTDAGVSKAEWDNRNMVYKIAETNPDKVDLAETKLDIDYNDKLGFGNRNYNAKRAPQDYIASLQKDIAPMLDLTKQAMKSVNSKTDYDENQKTLNEAKGKTMEIVKLKLRDYYKFSDPAKIDEYASAIGRQFDDLSANYNEIPLKKLEETIRHNKAMEYLDRWKEQNRMYEVQVQAPQVETLFDEFVAGRATDYAFGGLTLRDKDGQPILTGKSVVVKDATNPNIKYIQTETFTADEAGNVTKNDELFKTQVTDAYGNKINYTGSQLFQAKYGNAVATKTPAINVTPTPQTQVGSKKTKGQTQTQSTTTIGGGSVKNTNPDLSKFLKKTK